MPSRIGVANQEPMESSDDVPTTTKSTPDYTAESAGEAHEGDAQNGTEQAEEPANSPSPTVTPAVGNGAGAQLTDNRRRSGRVIKKPQRLSLSPIPSQSKRKRPQVEREDEDEEMDDAMEDNDDEGDRDEEEDDANEGGRGIRRASKKVGGKGQPRGRGGIVQTKASFKKPAPKRAKTASGVGSRPTISKKSKPAAVINGTVSKTSKKAKEKGNSQTGDGPSDGLFNKILEADNLDVIANQWTIDYEEDALDAMRQLINVFLWSCGCEHSVTNYDIEDQDSAAATLSQIQKVFQEQQVPDYPLISKRPEFRGFRKILSDFIHSLIKHISARELLYTDISLIENIQVWTTAMSSSSLRPFRHTATVISLNIVTTICDIASELKKSVAVTSRQVEAENKKSRKNQGRIRQLEQKLQEGEQRMEIAESVIKDICDTVFVHRYRDIDPKIRTDCVHELATWVLKFPDLFLDGAYLRYLGWILSDISSMVRLEVVKSLTRIYKHKENISGLRVFTEKFRTRLVEMATRDADNSVRLAAVELLDIIREAGFLEPEDVDAVGRLLFDSDVRMRKAVAGFFVRNIEELYEEKIDEEYGGQEGVEEGMSGVDDADEDYDGPRLTWIKLKCLVEVLGSYDEDEDGDSGTDSLGAVGAGERLGAVVREGDVQSRFSLAGAALYERFPEVRDWEGLAKYLLYDHSAPHVADDEDIEEITVPQRITRNCALDAKEESILLQVLHAAIQASISSSTDPSSHHIRTHSRRKTPQPDGEKDPDSIARILAKLIPPLLRKFGPAPDAASTVLRIIQLTNLDVYNQLRQTNTVYAALLDDINRQFLTHADESVLKEASAALLHAKNFEDLREVTLERISKLQDETIAMLMAVVRAKGKNETGGIATAKFSDSSLTDLINTVRRLEYLASITDVREMLETPPAAITESRKGKEIPSEEEEPLPINILLTLLFRGTSVDELEEELIVRVLKTLIFYFMWKIKALSQEQPSDIADVDIDDLQERRQEFIRAVGNIITSRGRTEENEEGSKEIDGMDAVRLSSAGALLDLFTLFATLRHRLASSETRDIENITSGSNAMDRLIEMAKPIPENIQSELRKVFSRAQKQFAKASHKTLEKPTDEDNDEITENEDEDNQDKVEDDDEETEQSTILMYEQRLCELSGKLVLAILGQVVDHDRFKKILLRNKTRLGQNYKEVVAHLESLEADDGDSLAKGGGKGKRKGSVANVQKATGKRGRPKKFKSNEEVEEVSDIEDDAIEDRIVVAPAEEEEDPIEEDPIEEVHEDGDGMEVEAQEHDEIVENENEGEEDESRDEDVDMGDAED